MSEFKLRDGRGSGNNAFIDSTNRLHTHALVETLSQNASHNGNAFNVNTGTIILTGSADQNGILYLKNQEELDIHITTIGFLIGNSSGGSGDLTLEVFANPTTGSLIAKEISPSIIENKNLGSFQTLDALVYKGSGGDTITGGTLLYTSLLSSAATRYVIATGDIVIPKGRSIAVRVTTQTGNSAMNIQVFLALYKHFVN